MTPAEIAFFTGLMTMLSGTFTFTIRALLKSNCIKVKCGCVECEREATHDPKELELGEVKSHNII
jgi:hypothetical protein